VAIQSGLFTVFAMFIARLIATWGPVPIAVQKVGSHIEAISWMTAGGFSSALSAFVGQNFGAGKWDRIQKGYTAGLIAVTIIGSIATILLVFFAKPIFKLFIPEPAALEQGIIYLRILGLSQIFMCWEIATSGSFNGLGRTVPPSVVSVILTGLRVPVAYLLALHTSLGLTGVWWSISMSSVVKGIILVIWFVLLLWRHPCTVKPQLVWQSIFRWDLKFLRDKRCIGGKS
jgi:Na+-driven multidrug efflux pump